MVDDREARRQAFLNRQEESKRTSEGAGLGFFRGDLQGVNYWKVEEGDHDCDIVPYKAGPNDPKVPEGEWTYVLEVFCHNDVGGVEGQSYICMNKTYKQPCAICEHRKQLAMEGADEALIKELNTSRYPRSIYNVLVYDSDKDTEKGVQVMHTSHYLMEMFLIKLAESTRRDIEQGHPQHKLFADLEEGYSVRFTRTGSGVNTRYLAHQLVQRNYVITEEVQQTAWQLDTIIHIPTYEEVWQAYWGEPMPADVIPGATALHPRGSTQARGPARTAPTPAADVNYTAPVTDAPVTAEQPATAQVCPGGGTWGVNAYELAHCEQCGIWEPCYAENERLLKVQAAAETGDPGAVANGADAGADNAGNVVNDAGDPGAVADGAPPAAGTFGGGGGGATTAVVPAGRGAPPAAGAGGRQLVR